VPKGPISKEASVAKTADFLTANITAHLRVMLTALCMPYCKVIHCDYYLRST